MSSATLQESYALLEEQIEERDQEIERLKAQVTQLQSANNREVYRRRALEGVADTDLSDVPTELLEIFQEWSKATAKYDEFASAHEGYAVLLEEVDELWDEVKRNETTRSKPAMKIEARQIGAMALRFMLECCR